MKTLWILYCATAATVPSDSITEEIARFGTKAQCVAQMEQIRKYPNSCACAANVPLPEEEGFHPIFDDTLLPPMAPTNYEPSWIERQDG
jgi:hypothetical protein